MNAPRDAETAGLRLFRGPTPARVDVDPRVITYAVNGYPAMLLLWTADQWGMLADKPEDAQPYGNGCWGALRIA